MDRYIPKDISTIEQTLSHTKSSELLLNEKKHISSSSNLFMKLRVSIILHFLLISRSRTQSIKQKKNSEQGQHRHYYVNFGTQTHLENSDLQTQHFLYKTQSFVL